MGIGCTRPCLTLTPEFLHFSQPGNLDVQRPLEAVGLRLDFAAVVDLCHVGVEEVCGVVGLGSGRIGYEGALGLGLHECDGV